jgi:MFS family permease
MNINKETARNLLDVRLILAALWISGMLCSLNGDTYRLSDPISLKVLLANTGTLEVGNGLLLVMSIIFAGYIFMGGLTLMLNPAASRRLNRIAGTFYGLVILGFWILGFVLGSQTGYAIVWSTAQLVFASLVVWYSWKWRNLEA